MAVQKIIGRKLEETDGELDNCVYERCFGGCGSESAE